MEIVYSVDQLRKYIHNAVKASPEHPILIDKFLQKAIEVDVDALGDGDEVNFYGSDPTLMDTDSDGFDDDVEVTTGSDPGNNASIPGVSTGDINGDGNVNVVDILLATRIAVGDLVPTTNQLLRGDVAPLPHHHVRRRAPTSPRKPKVGCYRLPYKIPQGQPR